MRLVDRLLSVLLILGAIGHTFGVLKYYHGQPDPLFWSLSAGLLIVLLAAINLLRSWRPGDAALAWIATGASAAYIVVTIGFGRLVGNMADPRVITFGLISLGLVAFGVSGGIKAAASRPS